MFAWIQGSDDTTVVVTPDLTDRDVNVLVSALEEFREEYKGTFSDADQDEFDQWVSDVLDKVISNEP